MVKQSLISQQRGNTIMNLTFQQFIDCEHKDPMKAVDIGIVDNITDAVDITFFYEDCYIQSIPVPAPTVGRWSVQLGNTETVFESKIEAAKYLYLNHYLPECTDLLLYREELQVPHFKATHTGGGCTALEMQLPNGYYIMITDDDASIPLVHETTCVMGLYNKNGDMISDQYWLTAQVTEIPNIVEMFKTLAEHDQNIITK